MGAHAIVIVLTDENTRQTPKFGHIKGLEDLALIGGTIAIEHHTDAIVILIAVGQANARTHRHLGTHYAIAAVEILAVHVHRATFAPAAPGAKAQQFGHDLVQGDAH